MYGKNEKMKYQFLLVSLFFPVFIWGCRENKGLETGLPSTEIKTGTMKLKVTIGTNVFTVTLADNETAKKFRALLPLTMNMAELNGNEKYANLAAALPVQASVPAGVQSGDLMLYGSNTLVLFYESFSTTYSYTRIGKIDNVSGLKTALGTGNVTVKFELQ